jgi:hypothetical protein
VIATRLRASIGFEGLPQLDNQSPFEYQELEFKIDQDTWCVDGFIGCPVKPLPLGMGI